MATLSVDGTEYQWDDDEHDRPYHDPDTLYRLYWVAGLSTYGVADICGCTKTTILRWMDRHGIRRRAPRGERDYCPFYTHVSGYERWSVDADTSVTVHRLLAVAEHGIGSLDDGVVHHRNDVGWDNRHCNVVVVSRREHNDIHEKYTYRRASGRRR